MRSTGHPGTSRLAGVHSTTDYLDHLRRIKYRDATQDKTLVFLTNNFMLPALTITELYRSRWQVELFFKWIKQHLRIKAFYGTSENAVKSQIWIAVSVYVLIAIIKKATHGAARSPKPARATSGRRQRFRGSSSAPAKAAGPSGCGPAVATKRISWPWLRRARHGSSRPSRARRHVALSPSGLPCRLRATFSRSIGGSKGAFHTGRDGIPLPTKTGHSTPDIVTGCTRLSTLPRGPISTGAPLR